jgi:carbonic anhydrase/acetyltransferase-like protein (isoleucine patch superfamily)
MIGHGAHLEVCIVEDGALVGSGSVVLHRASVRLGALVGANALVPNDMEVRSEAMALGIPAKLGLDAVDPEQIRLGVESYLARARWFAADLRRID